MVTKFDSKTLAAIRTSLRGGQYNLLLGSGVSIDSTNSVGVNLPSAETLRMDLCKLKNANPNSSLQRIYSILSPHEIREHIVKRFSGSVPGKSITPIPSFVWRRIFTFNVDDALEAAYSKLGSMQKAAPYNYTDQYTEIREKTEVPIVHLHGWVTKPDDGFVFSTNEYVRQVNPINPWMMVLSQFLPVEPFIIAGTSLEEYDLEHYLAFRTSITARSDRGPSILVEPFPDSVTERDLEKYGLTLYHGTIEDFFAYINQEIPDRPTAFDLIPQTTVSLFPSGTPASLISSFSSDFERVPTATTTDDAHGSRFLHGHAPSWSDLEKHLDVGRSVTGGIIESVIASLKSGGIGPRLFVLLDQAGGGKTTILGRTAKELSDQGITVLSCSALSRIDAQSTAEAIDLISGELAIIVDNFADQAWSIVDTIQRVQKVDVIFIGCEREYRWNYIRTAAAVVNYGKLNGIALRDPEALALIDLYQKAGATGSAEALLNPESFAQQIVKDPIAVACCRILNDFRPLERIVESVINAAKPNEQKRYLVVALAHFCLRGGVRFEILAAVGGREGWDAQFETSHPLPLDYFEGADRTFVVPLNGSIAGRVLSHFSRNNRAALLDVFVALAKAIAPRVNRKAVMNRTPEARLAGRLFDYDQVVMEFLGPDAIAFYDRTKIAWQWNSRYWEQLALVFLAKFQSGESGESAAAITDAVTHARHAVAIERHPLTMTTLAKILMAAIGQPGVGGVAYYDEAFDLLTEAINKERQYWRRVNAHAFVSLFRGTRDYIELGGMPTLEQREKLKVHIRDSAPLFKGDRDIEEGIRTLTRLL